MQRRGTDGYTDTVLRNRKGGGGVLPGNQPKSSYLGLGREIGLVWIVQRDQRMCEYLALWILALCYFLDL